jgi:2-aminoadipate transaminase
VSGSDVIVTSGAQQAIAIAHQVVCQRGDWIAVDDETYPAALDSFRASGVAPIAQLNGAAAAYAMPAMKNPRGSRASSRERASLLASGLPILEDDAYAEVSFTADPPAPLLAAAPERVLHIGTFSKTLCPGLRVGWLVPPRALRQKALGIKHAVDLQGSTLAQAILEQYLASNDFDAHIDDITGVYAQRAERLMNELRRQLPSLRFQEPEGGFSIWAETDIEGDDTAFLGECIHRGVSVDPGREFRPTKESSPIAMRLAFASVPVRRIAEGVRRLARAIDEFGRRAVHPIAV